MDWFSQNWGNIASVVGVALTIRYAWQAKTAAEQARDAAKSAREKILAFDLAVAVSTALTTMEEIKELHRLGAWDLVLQRYSALRKNLVLIEQSGFIKHPHRDKLRLAVVGFRALEDDVEERARVPLNSARLNKEVTVHIETLIGIMISIKVSEN